MIILNIKFYLLRHIPLFPKWHFPLSFQFNLISPSISSCPISAAVKTLVLFLYEAFAANCPYTYICILSWGSAIKLPMYLCILPWRRSVWQTEILVIFIYIYIYIWFLVCCVAFVLFNSVITYFDARIKISFHRPSSSSSFSTSGFLLLYICVLLFLEWQHRRSWYCCQSTSSHGELNLSSSSIVIWKYMINSLFSIWCSGIAFKSSDHISEISVPSFRLMVSISWTTFLL